MKTYLDKDLLEYLYLDCKLSAPKIADMLRCGRMIIYKNLHVYDISTRKSDREYDIHIIDKDLLSFLYLDCKLHMYEIAEILRTTYFITKNSFTIHNIPIRPISELNHLKIGKKRSNESKLRISYAHGGIYIYKDVLEYLYSELKLSGNEIARRFNCSSGNIYNIIKKYNIPRSESDIKEKISKTSSGKNNGMYGKPSPIGSGRGKGKYYTMPNGYVFWTRSTYERRVIDCLVSQKIVFVYEPHIFFWNNTSYTPDLYINSIDTYFEIKGYLGKKSIQKYIEFIESYPNIKIRIIFKKDILYIENLLLNNIDIDWNSIGCNLSEVV